MTLSLYVPPHQAASDEALVAAAAAGDLGAFEELYRRHHLVATRLAQRVTGNEDDARDAAAEAFEKVFGVVSSRGLRQRSSFRSYLLTAVRHVAIDKVRQRGRVESTDQVEAFEAESPGQGPADSVVRSEEERLLLEAFMGLPERARSVLWLVDVERVSAQEAADALGLTPNNVTQIAVRARGRLRHSYIKAHLRGAVERDCRFAVDHLGSYLEGALRPLSLAKVDRHVDGCASCQTRLEQLRTAGVVGRRSLLPVLAIRRVLELFRRPRKGVVAPEALVAQPSAVSTHLATLVSNPTVVDAVHTVGQSPVVQRVVAAVAVGTMTVGASSLAYRAPVDRADAASPPVVASVEAAAPTAAVGSPVGPVSRLPGPSSVTATVPSTTRPAGDNRIAGTVQPLSTSPATASVPSVLPPVSTPPPTSTVPPVTAPVVSTPPVTTPAPGRTPLPGDLVPPVTTPPLDTPPVSTPALSTPPLGGAGLPPVTPPPPTTPLSDAGPVPTTPPVTAPPLTTPPLSTPPLTTPPLGDGGLPPVTTPPVSTPPVETPPLSTPPLTTPPLGGGGLPPVTTPPVETPPLSTPPLTTPPLTTPPLGDAGLPPVTTPPVTTPPVSTPPLTTPPLSTPPVSTPPLSTPPVSTPPLTTPPVTAPPLSTPPVSTPPDPVPSVTTPPLSVPPVSTPVGTTPSVSTPPVSTPPLSSPPVSTPPLSTPPLSGPSLGVPPVNAALPDVAPVTTPPVSTPPLSTPPVSAPSLGVPAVDAAVPTDVPPVAPPPVGLAPVVLSLFR